MNIVQTITSSYHHQSNGQVKGCIQLIKYTIKECLGSNNDVNLVLLQMRSTSMCVGIPSPAMQPFNRPIWGLSHQMNKDPIDISNNDAQYEALKAYQNKYVKNNDNHKDSLSFPAGSIVTVQHEDGRPWTHKVTNEVNSSNQKGRYYIIRVMNIWRLQVQNMRHICSTPVTASGNK